MLDIVKEIKIPLLHRQNPQEILYEKYKERIISNPALDRTLVSFQANKALPFYSWFKYKEGFSQRLVTYLIEQLWQQQPGILLDPFAGVGATLFTAQDMGWQTKGIELLPVGIEAMRARIRASLVMTNEFENEIKQLETLDFAVFYNKDFGLNHIAITKGAFPEPEERQLTGYLAYCQQVKDVNIRSLLLFAAFCILEEISYTRKDGQYLRWDYRSGRSQGKIPFDKGTIRSFRESLRDKLQQILADLKGDVRQYKLFESENKPAPVGPTPVLQQGSCLELLPEMKSSSVDFVLTSPPYANRYDYTRTYALELIFLGRTNEEVKQLRQAMLSCTVENKNKRQQLLQYYLNIKRVNDFELVEQVYDQQIALQDILNTLEQCKEEGKLNNEHIIRLIRNYFYEMCFVIFELERILKTGGIVAMVNDNVRYGGQEIPVDLILANIAEAFGLSVRAIWTLGRGKGNSSQQMGNHGRSELRKCVYIWEKK